MWRCHFLPDGGMNKMMPPNIQCRNWLNKVKFRELYGPEQAFPKSTFSLKLFNFKQSPLDLYFYSEDGLQGTCHHLELVMAR